MLTFIAKNRALLIGALLSVCLAGTSIAQEPKRGGTLKISHSTRIATMNPLQLSGPAEYPAIDMLYSGLTRIGPDSTPIPDLAESWDVNADATQFSFKLRQGVTFHDGSPFTSADVKDTFEAILNPETASPARSVLDMIAAVETPDDHTAVFKLKASYADFPVSTAHANARIVSSEALAGELSAIDANPNGTGPFKMESYDSSRMLRLVKNENYYNKDKPYLDAVELHLFPDLAAESANFLSGNMDVMLNVQQADFERIASAPGVNALRVPSGRFINVVMRQDQPPFDDLRVREAMALAVDRGLLVDIILEGLGRPAYDNMLSPEFRYQIETPVVPYDPAKAKSLLAEAGHDDGLELTLVASNRPAIRGQVAIAIKQMAEPAGFKINVESMPHDTYLANVWRKGNFYMAYWGQQPTEDAAFTLLLTSDAAFEDTAWNNKEFDTLVNQGRSTPDEAKRAELYAQAQKLILRDKPYIIPFYQDVLTAARTGVHNWTVHPLSRVFYVENVWLDRAN